MLSCCILHLTFILTFGFLRDFTKQDIAEESLRGVVVDAVDKACNVATLVRADNKASRRLNSTKQRHHAIPIIIFAIL